MSSEQRAVINVFCSYSEEDRRFQEKLERHLASLMREGSVLVWDKHKVCPGQEHRREIDDQLGKARLILLLISSNFISSDDCYAGDLMKALQRRHDDNVVIIPILLKPCTWDGLAFSELQILPRNRLPVSQWRNQDEAFTHIIEELKQVVKDLRWYGSAYMEPLQPRLGSSELSQKTRSTAANQRSRITQATNGIQMQSGTSRRRRTNILRDDATMPTTAKYVKAMPRSRSRSGGKSQRSFLAFFFSNISGYAFNQRCKRWKGNSVLLLFLFALIDLFLLIYTVNQRYQSPKITWAIGALTGVLFFIGVFNEDNAIAMPVALIYFPIWIVMGEWYLNSYLGWGLSQLSILLLILIITIGRLFLFLWRSPFGQR